MALRLPGGRNRSTRGGGAGCRCAGGQVSCTPTDPGEVTEQQCFMGVLYQGVSTTVCTTFDGHAQALQSAGGTPLLVKYGCSLGDAVCLTFENAGRGMALTATGVMFLVADNMRFDTSTLLWSAAVDQWSFWQWAILIITFGAMVWAIAAAIVSGDRDELVGALVRTFIAIPAVPFRAAEGAIQPRFVLRRFVEGDLSGLLEDASTVEFDQDAPIVVTDTSELFARGDLAAQLTQVCSTAWIQAVISDRAARRTRYVVREEGWRDMTSLASLQMFQQWLKLSRHYGISNIVILHKMGDLDAVGDADSLERSLAYSIVGDIENKFIFRVNHQEQAALRARLNLPAPHVEMARQLRKGEFLAYVGQYSYLVDCFTTSTPWEYELFATDDAVNPADQDDATVRVIDTGELDDYWPHQPADPADSTVNGWLTAETRDLTEEL
ncbi:hypothetical protein J2X03_000771 [Microbacterium trichothecenolyticum]|uniref:hypothetical protein n=1 Tax=Microbacterium trichothecenolyticum TaxID=69370 RepID=UPI0028567983|nr:hypothetical protein [Microbacterium trichothecenolyticum]MDR7110915.1 hypothetical protein [Microbacterium trichothecenolyticum]